MGAPTQPAERPVIGHVVRHQERRGTVRAEQGAGRVLRWAIWG